MATPRQYEIVRGVLSDEYDNVSRWGIPAHVEAAGIPTDEYLAALDAVITRLQLAEEQDEEVTTTSCPWCQSTQPPVTNDDDPDPDHARINPMKCPECGGVGGAEDWFVDEGVRSS